MNCPKCGNQVPDGFRFCTNCGSNLFVAPQAPAAPEPVQPKPPFYGETQSLSDEVPVFSGPAPVFKAPTTAPAAPAAPADLEKTEKVLVYAPVKPEIPAAPVKNNTPAAPMPTPKPVTAPAPVPPAPAQVFKPTPAPVPQSPEQKKSGGFLRILPWIIVGVLAAVLAAGGIFGYKEYQKLTGERDKYHQEGETLKEEKAALQDKYDDLEKEFDNQIGLYSSEVDRLTDENESLNELIEDESVILQYYDDLLWYAENYNIGGTAEFGAEPAMIFMHTSDAEKTFKLNTKFENGSITMSAYGYSADGNFTEDNWGDSTKITVTAYEPGVSLLEFSLDDNSYPAFGVLIIVTD